MKLLSKVAASIALASCAFCASAKEVVFNPTVQNADGSYSWTNVNNWVGGALPGINDVQVYQPSGDLTVMPDNLPSGYYSGYYQFGGMKFLSGNTYFKQNRYWYANATTTEVYVAEGATVVNSNVVDTWNANYALAKTGKGSFEFRKLGEGKAFKLVDVREGTLHNLTVNGASYVKASAVRIRGDALYYAQGYNYFVDNPDMQIDAGGKLRVRGGSGKVNVKCLTGEGEIFDNDYWTDLQIKPDKDCVFSGTMSQKVYPNIITSATGRFILGNANAVAACGQVKGCEWLSFLPGIGTFTLGVEYVGKSATSPIVLEDTNGAPIKAIVGVMAANAPTFAATGAGSVEFKTWNVALTNNLVSNTGAVIVHDGTMTLGHNSKADGFDFSKPSEISANSYTTVAFRNSGTITFDGKVSGKGSFSFCPHGAGKKLTVEGVAGLNLRKTSSGAAVDVSINSLEIDHGVLFLMDPVAFVGANSSTVKLSSAPANDAIGRVQIPVVSATDYRTFKFLGYDAEKGFTNIVLAANTTFAGADASKPFQIGPMSGNWMSVAAGTKIHVGALHVEGSASIELRDNASITIGDGVNPALLLLPAYGFSGTASSALEFGTSEGVEIGILATFADGDSALRKGPFSNRARIAGAGADGKEDAAEIALFHSARGLRVRVEVSDAVHSQDNALDFLWRGDSLQIAFDTAPGYAYEYDEAIMQTRKKVSDIVVALGPNGPEFYRNRTYSERFLPTGRIAPERMPGSAISHVGGKTVYDLLIPWSEFGLSPEEAKPGLRLGFSLLVNDLDGKGTKRAYYGLFGGIADESGHNAYGYFTLMQ